MPNGFTSFDPSLAAIMSNIPGASMILEPTYPSFEIPLMPAQLQPPVITPPLSEKFGEYIEQPTVYEEAVEVPVSQPSVGPIETLWNILSGVTGGAAEIAGGALKTIGDTLKFISENLDVSIETTMDILKSDWAKKFMGTGGRTEAERLKAQELGLAEQALALQAQQLAAKQVPAVVPAEPGILGQLNDILFGKPAAYAVPEAEPEKAKPNILFYAGLGIAAFLLLKRK